MDWNTLPGRGENYESLPKTGEPSKVFDIVTIRKVTKEEQPNNKYWVMKTVEVELANGEMLKTSESQDWKLECELVGGKKLSISSLSPIIALKNSGVNDGMKIEISHPERGIWMVNILENESEEAPETPF